MSKKTNNDTDNFIDEILDSVTGEEVNEKELNFFSTGCYMLNALTSGSLYKGMPLSKRLALAGEEAVGKSFIALNLVKQFQDNHAHGRVVYFESESAFTADLFMSRGIDRNKVRLKSVTTIEKFTNQVYNILEKYGERKKEAKGDIPPLMIILDSLGMLSTEKELNDVRTASGKEDMTRPKKIRACFRVISNLAGSLDVPIIITNHVYSVTNTFIPMQKMSGGGGIHYAADTILFLSRRKYKSGDDVLGNELVCTIKKSRLSRENAKGIMLLTYKDGLDPYYGLQFLGMDYGIIEEKVGKKYKFPNGETGKWSDIKQDYKRYFDDDCMKRLEEAVQQEYQYHSMIDNENYEVADEVVDSEFRDYNSDEQEIEQNEKKKKGRPKKKKE